MYRLVIRGFELISIAIRAEVVATRKKGPAAKSRWKEFSKNFSAGERPRLWARSPCHVFTLFTRTHRERAYDQSVCYILFSFFYFFVGGGKKKGTKEIGIASIRLITQLVFHPALCGSSLRKYNKTKEILGRRAIIIFHWRCFFLSCKAYWVVKISRSGNRLMKSRGVRSSHTHVPLGANDPMTWLSCFPSP